MAGRNQRGPEEMGPLTGRGMGRCGGNGHGQGLRQGRGRGMGRGQGRGHGQGMGRGLGRGNQWRQNDFAGPAETDIPPVANTLVQEVAQLKSQLSDLTAKLNKLLEQA